MDKKINARDLGFLSLVLVILAVTVFALRGLLDASASPSSADVRTLIENCQVDTVLVKDGQLTMKLKEHV